MYITETLESSQVCLNINDFLIPDLSSPLDTNNDTIANQSLHEPVLACCNLCLMYMVVDKSHELYFSLRGGHANPDTLPSITCLKCNANLVLHEEIMNLKQTIADQYERIDKLKQINELENQLNTTINDIANGMRGLEVRDG